VYKKSSARGRTYIKNVGAESAVYAGKSQEGKDKARLKFFPPPPGKSVVKVHLLMFFNNNSEWLICK